MLKTIKNIPTRVVKASQYSLAGLKNAFIKEESIRLESLALAILLVAMLLLPWPLWKKLTIIATFLLIPLCELLNSAIEDVCDMASKEYNEYIKTAKDKGSAAVLAAIVINVLVLGALIVV